MTYSAVCQSWESCMYYTTIVKLNYTLNIILTLWKQINVLANWCCAILPLPEFMSPSWLFITWQWFAIRGICARTPGLEWDFGSKLLAKVWDDNLHNPTPCTNPTEYFDAGFIFSSCQTKKAKLTSIISKIFSASLWVTWAFYFIRRQGSQQQPDIKSKEGNLP